MNEQENIVQPPCSKCLKEYPQTLYEYSKWSYMTFGSNFNNTNPVKQYLLCDECSKLFINIIKEF